MIAGIDVVLKIAGVGILTAVINSILEKSDKKEIATFVTMASLIVVLVMVVNMVSGLLDTVKALFNLY